MANPDVPFKDRFSYWFDNKMSEGLWPKVRLLFVVTLIFVIAITCIAALSVGLKDANETFIRVLMYTLGKGGALSLGADGASPVYFIMLLLTILYCMFLSGILFGFITNAVRNKVDELDRGQSHVIENGHTIILGFNDSTIVLVGELIEANKNQAKPQAIVVLGETDTRTMVEQFQRRFGKQHDHPKTRIICRTGSPYSFNDLNRCSISSCRVAIVNGKTDFETVKTIVACSYVLKDIEPNQRPYVVTVVCSGENAVEVATAARNAGLTDNLEFLSLNRTLARIMVHTSRQPGLSDVFTELLNYSGHEIYLVADDPGFPSLYGKTIEEINLLLTSSFAIGIRTQEDAIIIGDPRTTVFNEGDALIVIEEDDDALAISNAPASIIETEAAATALERSAVNALVLGVRPVLDSVLREYAHYLETGSTIHVAEHMSFDILPGSERTRAELEAKGIDLVCHDTDIERRAFLRALLKECEPNCILVLGEEDPQSTEESDERIVRLLIYLREYRKQSGLQFSITSEIHEGLNKELVTATGPDDFIIGSHISALLMAQISQERAMTKVFEAILSNEGYEIYTKRASWYVQTDLPIDLFSASSAVAQRGDVLFGIRQMNGGLYEPAVINPPKLEPDGKTPRLYTFGPDDYFVVLSESGGYSDNDDSKDDE